MASGEKLIAENRRARFDYTIIDELEAGIELLGSEVKSLRDGDANLRDGYVVPKGKEMVLVNVHIAPYPGATVFGHEPRRQRRLLLHRNEIEKWTTKVRERGLTIIPLSLYFKNGRAKVKLGLCSGKTHEDRRNTIKKREIQRELDKVVRGHG